MNKNDFHNYCIALENLSGISMKNSNLEKANILGHKALKIASKRGYYLLKMNCYERLYEINLALEKYDSTFYYKELFDLLQDSTLKIENKIIVDELEAKYGSKKQNEISIKDAQIAEEKRYNSIYVLALMSVSLFILILIALIILKIGSNRQFKEKTNYRTVFKREKTLNA